MYIFRDKKNHRANLIGGEVSSQKNVEKLSEHENDANVKPISPDTKTQEVITSSTTYITEIDDIFEKVLTDFYATQILGNPLLKKIWSETNFVKYQKEINDLIVNYFNIVDLSSLKQLLKSNDAVNTVTNSLKRYIGFYVFLTIGFFYTGKTDTFINNIVEFSKNQSQFLLRISNFFNSENNALIIKFYDLMKNTNIFLEAEQTKRDELKKRTGMKNTIMFLSGLSGKFVKERFLIDDINLKCHNIVTCLIINNLYVKDERKDFFNILEMTENMEGEFMFIDVVMPAENYIDFTSVEQLLSKKDTVTGMAKVFWNFISENQNKIYSELADEEKISLLINSGVIIPICDNFLLYHKDTERYEKNIIDEDKQKKKKEDTRIKYIINKIDKVADYYSDNLKDDKKAFDEVRKMFYAPLLYKKAILVNQDENLRIVHKMLNLDKKIRDGNEYFSELLQYIQNPYVNFNGFEKNGISLTSDKSILCVRSVSFDTEQFKQNKKAKLQTNVFGRNSIMNIVGFIVTDGRDLNCLKINNVSKIKDYEKTMSEFNFQKTKPFCWLFDGEKTSQENIKMEMAKIYDHIIENIYSVIYEKLRSKKNVTLQTAYDLIRSVEKKTLKISNHEKLYNELERAIYTELIEPGDTSYDKSQDILFGYAEDILTLPDVSKEVDSDIIIKIDTSKTDDENIKHDEQEEKIGICQHNISWRIVCDLSKTNKQLYTSELYNFIQRYVSENVDGDLICNSCGNALNIKKFVPIGSYNDEKQLYMPHSLPIFSKLEEVPEYEKFKTVIKNMDRIIEKIADISGFRHFVSNLALARNNRTNMVREIIDLLIINNKRLKPILTHRNENASKLYNINRTMTNIFIFELDNTVYDVSSHDKDKERYKMLKQNNILTYVIILLLLELNESQIMFIGSTKMDRKGLCNFSSFEKYYHELFGELKIRISDMGDAKPIVEYKNLCYVLYIISCGIAKYKIWKMFESVEIKKNLLFVKTQKNIVNTVVDILNSILEYNDDTHHKDRKNLFVYEMFSSKFFNKLHGLYSNEIIYNKFVDNNKESVYSEKKEFIQIKNELMELSGHFVPIKYKLPQYNYCVSAKVFPSKYNEITSEKYELTDLTNCENGKFHVWKPNGNIFKCDICKKNISTLNDDNKTNVMGEKLLNIEMKDLAKKYCIIDGEHHLYQGGLANTKCTKCGHDTTYEYSQDELDKLIKIYEDVRKTENNKEKNAISEINKNIKMENSYIDKVVNKMTKIFNDDTKLSFVDLFIDELQKIVGSDIKNDTYLSDNIYIIDHDHNGGLLDKKLVLMSSGHKIIFKQNHPFFKTNVIYYTNYKNGKIEIYYDASSKILLGYKEESKQYIMNKIPNRKIVINYSLANKLKLLGYSSENIDTKRRMEKLLNMREDMKYNKKTFAKIIMGNIIDERINNLKKTIKIFQSLITKISSGKEIEIDRTNENNYFADIFNDIVNIYAKKLNNINIFDSEGHYVMKHWKGISRGIFNTISDYDEKMIESDFVTVDELNMMDNSGNLILCYIVQEFRKLLDYNENKMIKVNISNMLISFVNYVFELFNMDKLVNDIDIKRFVFILNSNMRKDEMMIRIEHEDKQAEDTAELSEEVTEEIENTNERDEAVDVDHNITDMYDSDENVEDDRGVDDYGADGIE